MENLEFLPVMTRVQQLQQRSFAPAKPRCFCCDDGFDRLCCMPDEKGFLGFQFPLEKTVGVEFRANPIPTYVAGEVLFTGPGKQVVGLLMAEISASCTVRTGLRELPPGFPVVAGQE